MNILIVLILISLLVAGGFVFAFIWAVKSGQYDDAVTPSIRMLWDEEKPIQKENNNNKINNRKS